MKLACAFIQKLCNLTVFKFSEKVEDLSENAVKVAVSNQIYRRDSAKEEKTAFMVQQTLATQCIIHSFTNEKTVELKIIEIVMHAIMMFLSLKISA